MPPAHEDIVTPILGASAGLGGFVLVFLGLVIAAYKNYPADTPKGVKDRVRGAAWLVLGAFLLSVISIALALLWLVVPGGDCFYWVVVGVFVTDLAAIVGVAAWTTMRLLR